MLNVPSNAPAWAFAFGRNIDDRINQNIWPFLSRTPFAAAELTAALAVKNPWRMVFVSDAPSNQPIAISDGAIFRYADGSAV